MIKYYDIKQFKTWKFCFIFKFQVTVCHFREVKTGTWRVSIRKWNFLTYKQTQGKNSINDEDGAAVIKVLKRSTAEFGNKKKPACMQVSPSNFRNNKTLISCTNLVEMQKKIFLLFSVTNFRVFCYSYIKNTDQSNISQAQLRHRNSPFHKERRKHRYK